MLMISATASSMLVVTLMVIVALTPHRDYLINVLQSKSADDI